jgi:hypothetical protein
MNIHQRVGPIEDSDSLGLHISGSAGDLKIRERVLRAMHELQDALDAGVLAGLIVEPGFMKCANRFKEVGIDTESWVPTIAIYRRLG